MCGIVAYIGKKQALPILLRGLRRLEYRGYDSAGMAIFQNNKIKCLRAVGKIEQLAKKSDAEKFNGTFGIAHTRWATHGEVTEENAHPHTACNDDLYICHNGIIENYREIRNKFLLGHDIKSETDTEILAHLIEIFYNGDILEAVQKALQEVRGTYGIAVMHKAEPNKLIVARFGSPLAIGIGNDEYYIASDTSPMLAYTRNVIFLDDGEVAEITIDNLKIYNLKNQPLNKQAQTIEWDDAQAEKQGYPHFMLKEIYDQPAVMLDAMRGRYVLSEGTAHLGGLNMTPEQISQIKRIMIIGCGTAYHVGLIAKYAFEKLANIPVEVDIASEFRYRNPIIDEHTLVFAISQSGETADTLAAVREAKRKGAFVRGIVNVIGSTISRETDGGTYIHAGPEMAVASTKAYTNMIIALMLYALQFGRSYRLNVATGQHIIQSLLEIPNQIKTVLAQTEEIKKIAKKYCQSLNFMYIGRGVNYPVALEGALKLREISYINANAFPAGELKHGSLALADENFPIFAIVTKNNLYDKMRSNIEEIKARKSPLILLANDDDKNVLAYSKDIIYVPKTIDLLEPLINTIPMQLFSYFVAVELGRDVDRPRNLAKSVTVE